ncbi:HNH endonuclease [Oxalicibacterium faecigallinarum]|nr:HNH endonuclease [Oxalicibacterium faecigallinarum]
MRGKSVCRHAGCSKLLDAPGYCEPHAKLSYQQIDQHRGSASSRGYNRRWQKARETYLQSHPLCVRCAEQGLVVQSTVVDHIIPHRGDSTLFWDSKGNWQALCKTCHDRKTATEDGGFGNASISKGGAGQKSDPFAL